MRTSCLQENENIRTFYQDEFKYVLVDEYQDTNAIQAELVHLLVKAHGNLMVVGDDFQSIYSWRGADFRNFLDFDKAYPGARTFKLQINYRSTPEILDVANEVIAGNPEQFQKELQAVRESDPLPHLVKVRDGSVQARYVIEKAQELNRRGDSAFRNLRALPLALPCHGTADGAGPRADALCRYFRGPLLRAGARQGCLHGPAPAGQSLRRAGLCPSR